MDDVCGHLVWNPSLSAGALVGYAGVGGSITLTVIVILLGHDDLAETRIGAILLFTVALFEMGMACIFFAAFAGGQDCIRSYVEVVATAPALSIGTVMIMAGVAWMFDVFEGDIDLERISRLLVYAAISVALAMHGLLAWSFMDDLTRVRAWTGHSLPAPTMLELLAAAFAIVLAAAFFRPSDQARRVAALRHATYLAISLTVTQLGLAMVFHVFFQQLWTASLQHLTLYATVTSSAITPLATFTAIVRCLPRPPPQQSNSDLPPLLSA